MIEQPPHTCPGCGRCLDAATAAFSPDAKPDPGDVTVCLYCGTVLVYMRGRRLREPRKGELEKLHPESRTQLLRVQQAVAEARARHGGLH